MSVVPGRWYLLPDGRKIKVIAVMPGIVQVESEHGGFQWCLSSNTEDWEALDEPESDPHAGAKAMAHKYGYVWKDPTEEADENS